MKNIFVITGLFLIAPGYAMEIDTLKTPDYTKVVDFEEGSDRQAHNLKEWFALGNTRGSIRYHFMGTVNEQELSDYWANAIGGRLYYRTATFHGFELGAAVNMIFNIGSSNLVEPDPLVGKGSRWEKQLFDLNDPTNKHHINNLDELYIKYNYHGSFLQFGKLTLSTPLVNEQDSRMKPTSLYGLWSEFKPIKKVKVNAGWFYKVSPRSTTGWFPIKDAIGIYGRGNNPDGTPSGYAGNINSKGLGILGLSYSPDSNFKIQVWDYYLQNVLNANFVQLDYTCNNYEFGFQYVLEDQVKSGGSDEPSKTYFPSGHYTNLFSGKIGYKKKKWKASINYTQALGTGRFTFPRELGTAKLFTSVSRHRVEGLGNFQTATMKLNFYPLSNNSVNVGLSMTRTHTDGVDNLELNKYASLTYNQLNLDLRYKFKNYLKGLDTRLLYVLDRSNDKMTDNQVYVFNKTNLSHLNLVINYNF